MKLSLPILLFLMINSASAAELREPITPLPQNQNQNTEKVKLGQKLFFEPLLSHNNKISCAFCHNLSTGGTDHLLTSIGINGAIGETNSPSVFNSGFNFVQFWDGRAATLEEQIEGPINNPKEMDSSWEEVIKKLNEHPTYRSQFSKIYSDKITITNIKDAIASYERALTTPGAKFDLYLQGNKGALSELEIKGYQKFKSYGCISCHQGVNIGGNMYQTMGLTRNYFKDNNDTSKSSLGRFNVTAKESDRHVFKVPSLRNIEHTAPYFHNGSASTLEQAIIIMGKYQLGRTIANEDINLIVLFLKTLTGSANQALIKNPHLKSETAH